nr:transposase [uncultured Niameybacter sp.]
MGRKARQWYENGYYHITCRGNHRNDIFRDEGDFQEFLNLIRFYLKKLQDTPFEVICYCLMDNHVHLLMRMSKEPLSTFMHRLNTGYARYFNDKYNYVGHLFQDRFFTEPISLDHQLLEVSRYIHLNPVHANMVTTPEEYTWSSYSAFIGRKTIDFLHPERILNYFESSQAPKLYQNFVESKLKVVD